MWSCQYWGCHITVLLALCMFVVSDTVAIRARHVVSTNYGAA